MRLHHLPFTISLDDFEIKYYDDSDDPSDYISRVTIDGEPVTISMNHIASRSGIRLYQMDFDPDLQGSILAMNSDPWGIPVTYCGYALLFVALLWILIDPKGQFRSQLSELRGRRYQLLSVLLLFVYAFLLYHFLGKYSSANHPLPVLNSWLLPVHVSTIIMAYLLLFVAIFVRAMLYPALAFLGYGIFIGAIWANVSWGNYWSASSSAPFGPTCPGATTGRGILKRRGRSSPSWSMPFLPTNPSTCQTSLSACIWPWHSSPFS